MLNLKHHLNKIYTLPLHLLIKEALDKVTRKISFATNRSHDQKNGTYCKLPPLPHMHHALINTDIVSASSSFKLSSKNYIEHYLSHRFDLLGSGWVKVYHGMKCRGLEGHKYQMGKPVNADPEGKWLGKMINKSNLEEAQRIWGLIDNSKQSVSHNTAYVPIDWHIDFKTGYRWSEKTWYKDIKYGRQPGVDVKVPWELARMQHLPQMALYYNSLPVESEERSNLNREFRNQILDFIATNPPRFGVNWFCTMDVAIRAANWVIAYNIFTAAGTQYDKDFEDVFMNSVYDHGKHIIGNLEWYNGHRGNHYLSNIAGLAFVAYLLPSTEETDAWLAFAVQELVTEVNHQFYLDGGNFEGSTAYHRLSAEMVYFSTALILGFSHDQMERLNRYNHKALKTGTGKPKLTPAPLPFYSLPQDSMTNYKATPFPPLYFDRMERMAEFIIDITKPNGRIPQIGDNDSGRFFKLGPKYEEMTVRRAKDTYANLDVYAELPDDTVYIMEEHLDCSHLVAAACGLFKRKDFEDWLGGEENVPTMLDYLIIKALSAATAISSQRFLPSQKETNKFFTIETEDGVEQFFSLMRSKEHAKTTEFKVEGGDIRKDIILRVYPNFGLYLFKSPRLYLAIRCWEGRNLVPTGHMHYDQLSIELVIDGKELVTDPGTYIYTALPERRNEYRSATAHFAPFLRNQTSHLPKDHLFALKSIAKSTVYLFNAGTFLGGLDNINNNKRLIIIGHDRVKVIDHSNIKSFRNSCEFKIMPYSSAYGWLRRPCSL